MFTVRPIIPAPINADALRAFPAQAMNRYLNEAAMPQFKSAVEHWSSASKPEFEVQVEPEESRVRARLVPKTGTELPWKFLTAGTKVRYVAMQPGYVPKTAPGRIPSVEGGGGVQSGYRVKPGIKPREWPKQIADATRAQASSIARDTLHDAVVASGHARTRG